MALFGRKSKFPPLHLIYEGVNVDKEFTAYLELIRKLKDDHTDENK